MTLRVQISMWCSWLVTAAFQEIWKHLHSHTRSLLPVPQDPSRLTPWLTGWETDTKEKARALGKRNDISEHQLDNHRIKPLPIGINIFSSYFIQNHQKSLQWMRGRGREETERQWERDLCLVDSPYLCKWCIFISFFLLAHNIHGQSLSTYQWSLPQWLQSFDVWDHLKPDASKIVSQTPPLKQCSSHSLPM